MNLKKSDKIIAIVGVVILIIAAVGIALYTSYGEEGKEKTEEPKMKEYNVEWTKKSGEKEPKTAHVGKSEGYEDSFSVKVPSNSVLSHVYVNINWTDDHTYGLLFGPKGQDNLTLEITRSGGVKLTHNSLGSADDTLTFDIYKVPADETIKAEDKSKAEQKIGPQDLNEAAFTVKGSISIGEPWYRPLKKFFDKGNDIQLSISYDYYQYNLEETGENSTTEMSSSQGGDTISTNSVGARGKMMETSWGINWI